jgi:hypothetical protein
MAICGIFQTTTCGLDCKVTFDRSDQETLDPASQGQIRTYWGTINTHVDRFQRYRGARKCFLDRNGPVRSP